MLLRASVFVLLAAGLVASPASAQDRGSIRPDVVVVTVDTLRYDRLSFLGYSRPTSPHLDRLLAEGVYFTQARVVEPLTSPSMCSMITSLHPHEHGSSRNGLSLRPGLPSLAKVLQRRGYRTTAIVGNWTLKDKLSGLGEHFDEYHELFSRKRWFGLIGAEATGEDLTSAAVDWLDAHFSEAGDPYLLWVHYVEPHEPYKYHAEFASRLGIGQRRDTSDSDRYDTEVAFVDNVIGQLLDRVRELPRSPLIVFASDHGESLGEHGYWGHGRHLYDVTLRIPMSFTWPGHLEPRKIDAPASLLDVAPTIFGLAGWPIPPTFRGFDWSPVLRGEIEPPVERSTFHQAHKGAFHPGEDQRARQQGLLEAGVVGDGHKEILRIKSGRRRLFDLVTDPGEDESLVRLRSEASEALREWLRQVEAGLAASEDLPLPELDEESLDKLRALGYVD